eukprot:226607-Rhodomonas_salina.1
MHGSTRCLAQPWTSRRGHALGGTDSAALQLGQCDRVLQETMQRVLPGRYGGAAQLGEVDGEHGTSSARASTLLSNC